MAPGMRLFNCYRGSTAVQPPVMSLDGDVIFLEEGGVFTVG
jgi:hypothetical protein